ncbi:MAG: hypothetical protein BGO57_16095 [Sphingomonadales bacterium 63-6]|nr:MAG: hypothetical protein BGO57_16095 [Sphingomonadales bacterium 63-6]
MSALDFISRALVVREGEIERRSSVIAALMCSIEENLSKGLPGLINVPIAENRSSTTQIASGKLYGFSSGTPANDFRHHFNMYGGKWENSDFGGVTRLRAVTAYSGSLGNPLTNPLYRPGPIRFATWADKFEVYALNEPTGFRMRVNGKFTKDGLYGNSDINGDANGQLRYYLFDFTGTEFAGQGLKQVEIIGDGQFRFAGVRVPITYTVEPFPQSFPLKAALHGDSISAGTIADSADYRSARYAKMADVMRPLTGISDIWVNGIGGRGFVTNGGAVNFVEQAAVAFTGADFDVVWSVGTRNDGAYGNKAAYQAVVESWIDIVLADNPDTIIVLTGPIGANSAESAGAAFQDMQDAKRAAAASYPRNCAFINTCGRVTADPWIFGSGRVGAPAGNGNADLVLGTDGVHPSIFGHNYLGHRLVTETARVLPLLASRIRKGVIAGKNDTDIV